MSSKLHTANAPPQRKCEDVIRDDDNGLGLSGLIDAFQERGRLSACSATWFNIGLLSRILRVSQDSTGKGGTLPSFNNKKSNRAYVNSISNPHVRVRRCNVLLEMVDFESEHATAHRRVYRFC